MQGSTSWHHVNLFYHAWQFSLLDWNCFLDSRVVSVLQFCHWCRPVETVVNTYFQRNTVHFEFWQQCEWGNFPLSHWHYSKMMKRDLSCTQRSFPIWTSYITISITMLNSSYVNVIGKLYIKCFRSIIFILFNSISFPCASYLRWCRNKGFHHRTC